MARAKDKVAELLSKVRQDREVESFQELHWTGSFAEYLELALKEPRVTRNAFQRLYDMILSHGTEEVVKHKERIVRYRFFADPLGGGRDAVFGLERPLQRLVNVLKSAACGYGAERRILLLHGPVGSAKSTVVRLLKRGLEAYESGWKKAIELGIFNEWTARMRAALGRLNSELYPPLKESGFELRSRGPLPLPPLIGGLRPAAAGTPPARPRPRCVPDRRRTGSCARPALGSFRENHGARAPRGSPCAASRPP